MAAVSLNIASFSGSIFIKKSYSSLNFEALIKVMKESVEPAMQQKFVCLIGYFSRNQ